MLRKQLHLDFVCEVGRQLCIILQIYKTTTYPKSRHHGHSVTKSTSSIIILNVQTEYQFRKINI